MIYCTQNNVIKAKIIRNLKKVTYDFLNENYATVNSFNSVYCVPDEISKKITIFPGPSYASQPTSPSAGCR
ncbi:MAG: hypothetical protein MUE56_06140, partial [Ignavibacteria bacterium]|nr:hypothetical protein [Ignavibacteria bacterium]